MRHTRQASRRAEGADAVLLQVAPPQLVPRQHLVSQHTPRASCLVASSRAACRPGEPVETGGPARPPSGDRVCDGASRRSFRAVASTSPTASLPGPATRAAPSAEAGSRASRQREDGEPSRRYAVQRPCSTSESVARGLRCQNHRARCFHGLGFPSRTLVPSRWCRHSRAGPIPPPLRASRCMHRPSRARASVRGGPLQPPKRLRSSWGCRRQRADPTCWPGPVSRRSHRFPGCRDGLVQVPCQLCPTEEPVLF